MVAFSKYLQLSLSLLASTAAAAPSQLESRAVIAHNRVVGFKEQVPDGTVGSVYLAYKPHLKVVNGCVPFPAVDAAGNTGGGLKPTGLADAGCSSSTGQVYVRGGQYGSHYAVMYSWYFPKDEPSSDIGHRHDWEGVIVWLKDGASTSAANIAAVCPSGHGKWDCVTGGYTLAGTSPLLQYMSGWPLDHSLSLTTSTGGQQPLIAWESLTSDARSALQNTNFGAALVPFKDGNFVSNLAKATF